jgi:LacI family transcriptional regulator
MSVSAHITLSQVAAAAGVSLATASYSLRKDHRISNGTMEKVVKAARDLGYRPNPRVSALMAHIRQAKPVTLGERIAFLWIDAPQGKRPYERIFDAAKARAMELGYTLEEFWRFTPGVSAARLQQIIHTRGIVGLLISPSSLPHPNFEVNWDWSLFAPVIIGTAEGRPDLHHSAHHHYEGMRVAMSKLWSAGNRRILGLFDRRLEERSRRAWSAAFMAHHPIEKAAKNFLIQVDSEEVGGLPSWIKSRRPDAIVGARSILEALLESGWSPPSPVTVIFLDWVRNRWRFGGINQCPKVIAANAVDLVVSQLRYNERGVPENVKILLSAGHWVSGR